MPATRVKEFLYTVSSHDGCTQSQKFAVEKKNITPLPAEEWDPMPPKSPAANATLMVVYHSGRSHTLEIDGEEHDGLTRKSFDKSLLHKLMDKIVHGKVPGRVLSKTLDKVYDKWEKNMPVLDPIPVSVVPVRKIK